MKLRTGYPKAAITAMADRWAEPPGVGRILTQWRNEIKKEEAQ
jgi:hypothetical protein